MVIAAHLKAECPIIEFTEKAIENRFTAGAGTTVSVISVDYGKTYNSPDGDIRGKDRDTFSVKMPVTVGYKTNPVELHQLDRQLNLKDYETQIVKPRISLLASMVNEEVIGKAIQAASYSIVSNMPDFKMLANAIAKVRTSKVGDRIAGVLSHDVQAAIAGTGMNQFSANNSLGTSLYGGKINMFGGIDWLPTADSPILENPQAIAGATLAAPIANNSNSIAITFAGSGTLKKYTPFTIAGVKAVNAQGRSLNIDRTFIVAEDTSFTAATVNVPVSTVWIERTSAGFLNASSAGAIGAAAMFPLAAGAYNVGCVFASKAVAFASVKPKPIEGGVESASSNIEGLNILMSVQGNVETLKSIVRWDVLTGCEPLYQQGALSFYTPVA
jgi:hypothetical protein